MLLNIVITIDIIDNRDMKNRGYFGIGVYHPKTEENIGTLWRSAQIYGADFIFTIGRRYKKQASDTLHTFKHIPLYNYASFDEFIEHLPYGAQVICIELHEKATSLPEFKHLQQAVYLLGAEDHGLPEKVLENRQVVQIPQIRPSSMNVAVAGSIVLYDRYVKMLSA